jgi:hypothetical protein
MKAINNSGLVSAVIHPVFKRAAIVFYSEKENYPSMGV